MADLNLEGVRREYSSRSLSRKELPQEPIALLSQWIEEAVSLKVNEPTAMIVATATPEGKPSMRTVLLKEVKDGKLIFYSNYESRKGLQIAENPNVAITFLWHELERQIHLEGMLEKLSPEESDAYFDLRPYKSRIGARVSPQSRPIPAREWIMVKFAAESLRYVGRKVPRPDSWGGWAFTPNRIEFWQGRDSRLHDRFLYTEQKTKEDIAWKIERLAP